jgi:hypothetical protein
VSDHDKESGFFRVTCNVCGSFRTFRRRPGGKRRFAGPWTNPNVIDTEFLSDDEVRDSLKTWVHSAIDRGATLPQLGEAFLAIAAGFFEQESGEDFAARALLVHSMLPRTAAPDRSLS